MLAGATLSPPRKLAALVGLLPRRPSEFMDRVRAVGEVSFERVLGHRGAYQPANFEAGLRQLEGYLGQQVDLHGSTIRELDEQIRQRLDVISDNAPFRFSHNADVSVARLSYAVCRLLRPSVVVETGVAYGVTSAHILAALHENGHGELHSVDLPPLGRGADDFVGAAIPRHLIDRWHLHRGASRRVLPMLIDRLDYTDVFIHDSLHTFWNMRHEFATVWPHLRPGGMMVADDIQDNRAFAALRQHNPTLFLVLREVQKSSVFGVVVK